MKFVVNQKNKQCRGVVRKDNARNGRTRRCQVFVSNAQLKVCVNPKQDMCNMHCDCEGCSNKYKVCVNRGKRFDKLRKQIYDKEHRSKPEVKAKAKIQTKEYRNRPEVKQKYKEWYNTPETKQKRKQQRKSRLENLKLEKLHNVELKKYTDENFKQATYETHIKAEKDIEKLRFFCLTFNRTFPYLMSFVVKKSRETFIVSQKEKEIEKYENRIKELRREIDEVCSE